MSLIRPRRGRGARLTSALALLVLAASSFLGLSPVIGGSSSAQEQGSDTELLNTLASGAFDQAVERARQLASLKPPHRIAHLLLGVDSYAKRDLAQAEAHFRKAATGPIGELTSTLALAWTKLAQGEPQTALDALARGKQPDWAQFYLNYHRALVADAAGRASVARTAYQKTHKEDPRSLRGVIAYARHAAAAGDVRLAIEILDSSVGAGEAVNPMVRALREEIEAGQTIPLIVATPQEGLAEVFYGLGEAFPEGAVKVGQAYLQMALRLRPNDLSTLAALANAYEARAQYAAAIDTYDRIAPGTPLQWAIDVRKAYDLNLLDKVEEAKALLERRIKESPTDLEPPQALGSILRSRKRFAEAAEAYTQAVKLISKPERRHWSLYYARGVCYERIGQWPKAELDLKQALELDPNQALVLNYLGYSWIERNKNLGEAVALVEKAAKLKPDDPYIVDSLGWAHFKIGNLDEAVRHLQRAHALKPDDPILADHLADALWRTGRKEVAREHWEKALRQSPEPELAATIRTKIGSGLPDTAPTKPGGEAEVAPAQEVSAEPASDSTVRHETPSSVRPLGGGECRRFDAISSMIIAVPCPD